MVMIMMKMMITMMTWNLKCVHHRLQNTSFYSRCPPPDYKCHQVSTVFTQIHQIPTTNATRFQNCSPKVTSLLGHLVPEKLDILTMLNLYWKLFLHLSFFLVRFMQKAWLIEVVGGGSRTEDFPYSAGWVICIIFIINYNYFDHNHGKKKKMTIMIMLFIVIISDIRWRRWSPSSRSSSPWWSLSSPQWSLWWDDEDHHENHDKMTRMGLKWSWLSL